MSTINLRWPKPIWEEKKKKTNVIARNNNKKWSKKRLVPSLAATEEDGTAANLVRFIYPKSHAPSIERVASQKGRDGPPPIASGWSAQHHSSSPFHKRVAQVKFFPAKEKNKPHDRVLFPPNSLSIRRLVQWTRQLITMRHTPEGMHLQDQDYTHTFIDCDSTACTPQ